MPHKSLRTALTVRLLAGLAMLVLLGQPVWALSEIKREELPASNPPVVEDQPGELPPEKRPSEPIPFPDPVRPVPGTPTDTETDTPVDTAPPSDATEPAAAAEPAPEILRDLDLLPAPVKRMRELIVEACKTGDIEKLRPLLGTGESKTTLSFGGVDGDPIEYLRGTSGDAEGVEILAILEEVLEAGFVHLDAGKDTELYVWPYFYAIALDTLTKPQRVELFKLITAGDYEDMQSFGAYIFFRAGITPDGRWAFFVAGD